VERASVVARLYQGGKGRFLSQLVVRIMCKKAYSGAAQVKVKAYFLEKNTGICTCESLTILISSLGSHLIWVFYSYFFIFFFSSGFGFSTCAFQNLLKSCEVHLDAMNQEKGKHVVRSEQAAKK
jgi:hypothetical protein